MTVRDGPAAMSPLIWMLTWLPQVLSAMSELPQPINLTLTSSHLNWKPGPGTPTDVYYCVYIITDSGTSWRPVTGCERVQHPLVCDLRDAFSDPRQPHFVQVTAQLEAQTSKPAERKYTPLKHIQLELPLLTVTPCDRNLCVDFQLPTEDLKNIYHALSYNLKIKSQSADGAQFFKDIRSLERQVFVNLAPGREYCVSVRISDKLESKESNYSQPVCAFTSGVYSADPWISAVFSLLVVIGVVVIGLLVFTGVICLSNTPLPQVLTSIHHIESVLVVAPYITSLPSLLDVKPTLPSSGKKRSNRSLSDNSDEESGGESTGGSRGCYKLQMGTNLLSSSSSSSSSSLSESCCQPLSPEPEEKPSFSLTQTSTFFSPQPVVPVSTETQSSAGLNHTLSTHTHTDSVIVGIVKTDKEKKEVVGEEDKQDVNLLTLTFGRHKDEEEKQSYLDVTEVEPESHSTSQTWDTNEVVVDTVLCSADEEEEEEEHSGYMGRPCTDVFKNLL